MPVLSETVRACVAELFPGATIRTCEPLCADEAPAAYEDPEHAAVIASGGEDVRAVAAVIAGVHAASASS
jgi:hypothetical protein